MDTYGFLAIGVGIVGYFLARNKSDGWAKFFLWVSGVGVGVVVAAVWIFVRLNPLIEALGN